MNENYPNVGEQRSQEQSTQPLNKNEFKEVKLDTTVWAERSRAEARQGRKWWNFWGWNFWWWSFWTDLPAVNQVFLGGGTLLLGLVLWQIVGPPVSAGWQAVVRPYTAAGKQEICLSRLQALAQAISLYQQDYDNRYPLQEYQRLGTKRTTWVTSLSPYAASGDLLCPLKPIPAKERSLLSSYGLNPVLAGRTNNLADPVNTLLLADRAEEHDVALLPPFPSWPSLKAQKVQEAQKAQVANIDFRHSNQAGILCADGHAATQMTGDWLKDKGAWGGAVLFATATQRILNQHPALARVAAALERRDQATARKLLLAQRRPVRTATQQLLTLWKQNAGSDTDSNLEGMGWRLARLWRAAGDPKLEQELNREQAKRSHWEWQQVQDSSWQEYQSQWGFTLQYPAVWSVETETEGKYRNTSLRSGSPYITVLIEKGERAKPTNSTVIDWSGMESGLRRRYHKDYKRIRMDYGTLGGQPASLWEFEIKRAGEPRLRKLYLGHSQMWQSYVIACTAPAVDSGKWQPVFEQVSATFAFQTE